MKKEKVVWFILNLFCKGALCAVGLIVGLCAITTLMIAAAFTRGNNRGI